LQDCAINLAHAFPSSQYKLSENRPQTRIPSSLLRRGWDGGCEFLGGRECAVEPEVIDINLGMQKADSSLTTPELKDVRGRVRSE
jgi:hypothetical protein